MPPLRRGPWAGLIFFAFAASALAAESRPASSPVQPARALNANLSSIGSDNLNNLMSAWAERFRALHPNVSFQVEGRGSSTAIPALIEGTAQIGPMSRPATAAELQAFERKFGYPPQAIQVGLDALGVFVPRENPLIGLTLDQLEAVFSEARQRAGTDLRTWDQLGLGAEWRQRPLERFGRNSASGAYEFFRQTVLRRGDFRADVRDQPGASAVVQAVASAPGGIGYSGLGYGTSRVRALALGQQPGALIAPTPENCASGAYPLVRPLLLYVHVKPGTPLEPALAEFLRFVVSEEGQAVVQRDGFIPVASASARTEPPANATAAVESAPLPPPSNVGASSPPPAQTMAPPPAATAAPTKPGRAERPPRRAFPPVREPMELDLTDWDVRDVLEFYAHLTGKPVILDSTIQGQLSVRSPGPVPRARIVALLEGVLLLNGFTLVDRGEDGTAVLGLAKNARGAGIPVFTRADDLPSTPRVVTLLFRLRHREPSELQPVLQQYVTANLYTSFVADSPSRTLAVTESTPVLRQLVRLLTELDTAEAGRIEKERLEKQAREKAAKTESGRR